MDPFEEFEFKPLTEGLGFQKKSMSLKEQVKGAGLVEEHLQTIPSSIPKFDDELLPKKPMTFDDVISSLEKAPLKTSMSGKNFLEVTEPLPRPREQKQQTAQVEIPRPPLNSPFPSQDLFRQPVAPVKKTPAQRDLAQTGTRRGAADSPQGIRMIPASASLPSAFLDFVVITAISMIFLAALLSVTKVDLNVVLRAIENESWTRLSVVLLVLALMQMYVVVARAFYGRTLGEWTFDVQLGSKDDQADTYYPLRVIARSLLVTVTGIVALPILSLLSNQDVAGQLTGLQLYRQEM